MIPPHGRDDEPWSSFRSIEAARLRVVGDAQASREADRRLVGRVDRLSWVFRRLLLLCVLVFGAHQLAHVGVQIWHCSQADDHALAALLDARAQLQAHRDRTGSYTWATLTPAAALDPYEVHIGFASERGFQLVALGRPGSGVAGDAWELDHRRDAPVHLTGEVCSWR